MPRSLGRLGRLRRLARPTRAPVAALVSLGALLGLPREAQAIRPFVTDDAHVVGKGNLQLETYWRRDAGSLQHWVLPALGPTDWLEVTLGGVHGLADVATPGTGPTYSVAGPLLQSKILLHESIPNRPPSVAVVAGGVLPVGTGGFEAPGWNAFTYLAVTQAFIKEDDFLIHANVGVATVAAPGLAPAKVTWGVGTQVETIWDFHLIGEVFSGDPYTQGSGGAAQGGFRIIFDEHLQLDGTVGSGLWGDTTLPVWFSSGVRFVSDRLF